MEISNLIPHIESLIFASDKPLTSLEITELINQAFGFMEDKIVMEQVTRGFTHPDKVAAGKPALGRPRRELVTVAYCKTKQMREMIEADRARLEG